MYTKKKLGIIGGMGSFASSSLYHSILSKSPARIDQEHLEILIHNNSRIPDRTQAILYGGEEAVHEIIRSARIMDQLQIDFLLMACVTAHHYYDHVQSALKYSQIIDLRETVKEHILEHNTSIKSVGILGTTAVVKMKLWNSKLQDIGVEVVCLPEDLQENLFMEAVYGPRGLKAGYTSGEPKEKLIRACDVMFDLGADAILSSCSEMPLILKQDDIDGIYIDAFDILTTYTLNQFYQSEVL